MKKTVLILSAFAALFTATTLQSCKNETGSTTPTPNPEFIADNATFKGFESWHLHTTLKGTDPARLGKAHAGSVDSSERKVYFTTSSINKVNGEYPVGTIISKKTTWKDAGKDMSMITAMAKQGNGFDATGNNWEYFILNADGSILVDGGETKRGSNLNNGGCRGCHGKAADKDYIFTK